MFVFVNLTQKGGFMATLWQKKVKCALIMADMSYGDLANAIGRKEGYIRQLLSENYVKVPPTNPTIRAINEELRIEEVN